MLFYLCFAGLLTLLILAAIGDLRERRIPNRLTGSVAALYPLYVLISPIPVAWVAALGLAALVFLAGLALFARELIGGGDVKLIAALSLWAGPEQFVWFLLVTTLTGGVLSLISLWSQRWGWLIQAHVVGLLSAVGRRDVACQGPRGTVDQVAGEAATLPYGIAIAAGGIAVVIELLKL